MNKIERIKELVKQCNEASKAYYTYDKPIMSDKNYDALYDELSKLEIETSYILSNSPTQKVQGEILPYLKEVIHTELMLSADKSKDINNVIKFMGNQECVLSWKLDGLTLVLRYNNGKFQQAITRGGGEKGEDVTHTVKVLTNIPLSIDYKGYLEIRGEGLVLFNEFERINAELISQGEDPYSNCRSLASGSVRQLNSNITKSRNLILKVFGIVKCDENYKSKMAQFEFLKSLGFDVVEYTLITKNELEITVDFFKNKIEKLPYLTDGLIVEYDDILYGKAQGFTEHHSKALYALKWNDDSYETVLQDVELNTTRTGMVSLTGIFDTINIDGSNVSRASLHNYDIFEELQLGVGDKITVYKANSVIPQVEDNLTRSGTYKINMKCPSCGSDTVIKRPKEARFLFCTNLNCPAQLIQKLTHFVSKDAMNIDGLSEATLEKFIDIGLIETFLDIYKLEQHKSVIIHLNGFGKRSYEKLIEAVENSKEVDMANFIYSLGIPQIGKGGSKRLAKHFNNDIQAFLKATELPINFINIEDFGNVTAISIYEYFYNKNNRNEVEELLKYVNIKEEKVMNNNIKENPFKGKHVYPTGKFNLKKDELKIKLEELGAIVEGGYRKSLDMLICGSDMSKSGKAERAKSDNITIITEEYLSKYIK